jgi:aspartyl/asparaginyl-tRNA synthetase
MEKNLSDFKFKVLSKCLANRLNKPLPRITFIEAIKILGRPLEDRKPLNKRDEMNLVNWFQGPLFITHFPSQQKAFYMRRTMDEEFVRIYYSYWLKR